MKKFYTFFAALLMAATVMMAADNSDKYITKKFDCKNFSGIDVGSVVDVTVLKSSAYKVEVTLPEDLEPYLKVKVNGGDLKITLENVPSRITRKMGEKKIEATVSMPTLRSLELSGASRFRCEDTFDLGDSRLELEVGGASRVNKLIVSARGLDAEIGGASYVSLEGDFETAEIEMSGAGKGLFGISADKVVIDLSGASKPDFRGDFDEITLDISGASEFNWTGRARKMRLDASGAAKVRASGCPVDEIRLEASGAAKCDVDAVKYISIDASGASNVHYVGHEGLMVDLISVSRAASVTKSR
ncbi:MAG: DUF2807 domain-containing protein [Bacteroidales bacterium]|nr:DUF2807 domain-containing protein [Bacteroidales bacterium]